ncbi:MAG: 50S ribosomal protein L21 [Candidatus Paceibacterota bacterium]
MTKKTATKAKAAPKKVAAKKAPAKKAPARKTAPSEDFSVIETGGKQYIVSVGDVIDVELLSGEMNEGDKVVFDKVLLSDDGKGATIGTPYIDGAKVTGTYLGLKKGKKLSIVRFKAKSNRDRKIGHRQKYAKVEITALG